jgi:serine/threonine protein kinase
LILFSENDHPSVLKHLGFQLHGIRGRDGHRPLIITPLMPHGNMKTYLLLDRRRREWDATMKTKSKAIFGIAARIVYLHFPEIVHRDLKPENVYFNARFEAVIAGLDLEERASAEGELMFIRLQ